MLYSKEIHEKVILGILYMCLYICVCVYYVFIYMYIWSLKSINRNKKHIGNFLSFQTRTLLNTVWDFFLLFNYFEIKLQHFSLLFPPVLPIHHPPHTHSFRLMGFFSHLLSLLGYVYMYIHVYSYMISPPHFCKLSQVTAPHLLSHDRWLHWKHSFPSSVFQVCEEDCI